SAHIHIAVSRARTGRIHGQADAGLAFAAIAAAPAGDVERNGNQVTDVQHFDVATLFDDLARDLMTEDQTLRGGCAAADHVLIRSADVGGHYFQNDAMRSVFPAERIRLALGHLELRVGDGLNFHHTWLDIGYSTIRCHTSCLLLTFLVTLIVTQKSTSDTVVRTRSKHLRRE